MYTFKQLRAGLVLAFVLLVLAVSAVVIPTTSIAYLAKSVHTDVAVGTSTYTVSFAGGMQTTDDIEVWVNGTENTAASVVWLTGSTLQLVGYSPAAGDDIEFRRVSPKTDNLVDLEAGKTIRASSLMKNFRHVLQVGQEAYDASTTVITLADESAAAAIAAAEDAAESAALIDPDNHLYVVPNLFSLGSVTADNYTTVYLAGHTTQNDGGQGVWKWDSTSEAPEDNGTVRAVTGISTGRWIRQLSGFVTPEMFGCIYDVSAPYLPINLSTLYSLPTDLTISKPALGLIGNGWSKDSNVYTGTVLSGTGGLIINSPTVSFGFTLRDLAVEYTGTGSAITVDDVLNTCISNINVDCNASGTIGINVTGDSYFAVIEKATVQSFTDTGILINTTGTKSVIRDSVVVAGTGSDANYGIEIRDEGVSIYDGQVNIERTDGEGVGIFFNNTSGAQIYGGLVDGTLSEKNTGIKIDGTTRAFSNVVVRNTRYTLGSGQKGIIFERAYNCTLENPFVYAPTGGTIATWGANSIKCGLIAGYDVCRSGISVDVAATNAYKICTEPITYAQRASITVAANLTTTVNECQYFGKTTHNGTAWDKHFVAVADDAATSITPPKTVGSVKIQTTAGGGEYILANYNTTTGVTASIFVGAGSQVSATDGTLTGTGGTDGYITLRSSSDGNIYIENRRGSSRSLYVIFE